ncbi:uncharacterized protein LOC127801873 [Diospyros lotus]|uniref:uncharacterized protein LOC127801873 n=1 Tax=Diospyros lotus TaxID=55363 RepID=UPI00224FBA07|nr:uncharacterized protein LOC127801873 [Diospyros lotus]
MGACASFPKGMKGGAPVGPPPEAEKEEDIATAATSDVAEEKAAAVREVAVEGEEENTAGEDVTDKSQSLGSLLYKASETQTALPDTVNPSPESEGKAEAVAESSSQAKESKETDKASETQTTPMETVKAGAAVAVPYPDDGEKAPAAYIAGEEKVAKDQ